jgi:kynureninase
MGHAEFKPDRDYARRLDAAADLREYRDQFEIQDPNLIYMDGNSLGRLPRRTMRRMEQVIGEEWGDDLIRAWGAGWFEAPQRIGGKVAALLGAQPHEVVISDSTSINLFKLAVAALRARPDRTRIVSDELNFPTDLYVLQGAIDLLGDSRSIHLVPSPDGIAVEQRRVLGAIDEQTALVTFSHPTFKSAYLYDVQAITERAHEVGALTLWDFSHAVGVVPLALDDWQVDLAVGCTYKYLNGGPGSPAFLYVQEDLQTKLLSPIWGWWGHRSPFAFELDYQPAADVTRFLAGCPPCLSLLAVEPGVDLILGVGMERIRRKSVALSSYLIELVDALLSPLGFELGSPRDPDRRGSHVSVRHLEGYRICQALIEEMNVIPDFREPDNIRLAEAPLYTSFAEVWEAVDRIRRVVEEQRYGAYSHARQAIT